MLAALRAAAAATRLLPVGRQHGVVPRQRDAKLAEPGGENGVDVHAEERVEDEVEDEHWANEGRGGILVRYVCEKTPPPKLTPDAGADRVVVEIS